MTVENLRRLEHQFLSNDRRISAEEGKQLVDSTWDFLAVSKEERAELRQMLVRDAGKLDPAARQTIVGFLQRVEAPVIPSADPIRCVLGPNPGSFSDDTIFLGRDGTVHGESGVSAYTRAYDATKVGPLRSAHGSPAPDSPLLTTEEYAALKERTPGQSLDAAAGAFGVRSTGFETLANSKDFFDPSADYWWGKCHAWAWSALSKTVDKRVDVAGPEGQKGLWIAGQWLSRADLGNWMMATADEISIRDPQALYKGELTASELVKGTTQFMMNDGGGVVADIYNDKKKGHKEVWNQPFVSSDLTTQTIDPHATALVLRLARREGVSSGVAVKQLTIVGTYGVEQSDAWEGAPGTSHKTWNLYAVTDANGKLLTAYMADDRKLDGLGVPTRTTDDLPEYFWKPKLQAIDDVLAGRRNANVETDRHGAQFKFFVGTVLTRGVSGEVRAAFEAELLASPPGPLDEGTLAQLKTRYPTIANAYSPQQWKQHLAPRGLEPLTFGALWPPA